MLNCRLFPILLFTAISSYSYSQTSPSDYDSTYIQTFEESLTARIYLAKKYSAFSLQADENSALRYRPNSLVSMGVNASYKALSISLGSGFGFLNKKKDEKGRTKSFDFTTHLYTRNWVTDIYAQLYKGYYFKQDKFANTNGQRYFVRPDIRLLLIGASAYKLLNGSQFSYRAGFIQNEWQKKSAGSVLLGGEIYYGTVKGDSAFIPTYLKSFYPQRDVNKLRVFEFGPGAGYAYTAVLNENFFATGSLTINVDVSIVNESKLAVNDGKTSVSPNATLRAVAGYNSADWAAVIGWVHNSTNMKGPSSNEPYGIKSGNFNITIARRFNPGKKFKDRVEPILRKMP